MPARNCTIPKWQDSAALSGRSASRPDRKPPSFFDLGTGSGILAIAAAKLGYSPVHALILIRKRSASPAPTPASIASGKTENPARRRGKTAGPAAARQYDLVCANLISDLLIAERRRIAAQLNRTGTLVLAGILKSEFTEVQKAFETLGLKLVSSRNEKEWRSGSFRFGS